MLEILKLVVIGIIIVVIILYVATYTYEEPEYIQCPNCKGKGVVQLFGIRDPYREKCDRCNGKGNILKDDEND